MRIGVPREVKNHEYRVALTPAGARELVRSGHDVLVERGAGVGSSITDADFEAVGAHIVPTADEVWAAADLLLKVKEPIAQEYHRLRRDQVLFTYLHLAASAALHGGAARVRHHRDRLRDRAAPRRHPAAARPDERGRGQARPAGGRGRPAGRRGRARRAARRRARRAARPRSW